MFSNISSERKSSSLTSDPDIINAFNREVNNNVQLIDDLRRENEQLKNTIKTLTENQRNTDRLIEQKNALIKKMVKDQVQLNSELNMARERERSSRLFSEQLSTHNNQLLQLNSNLHTQHKDQLNAHQEELKQLIESLGGRNEEIEEFRKQNEERNTVQLQNLKDSIEQTYFRIDRKVDRMQICLNRLLGKFVFVCDMDSEDFLSSDNVESINIVWNNLDSLVHSISSYRKELLILTDWEYMNSTSRYADGYAKLLSLCQKWKRLRPDGEIHCLYYFTEKESPSEPDDELASLLTTCNKYLKTDSLASHFSPIRQYWPNFADLILSEKIKNEYPA